MTKRLLIERVDDDGVQTIGTMYVLGENDGVEFYCHTLELPWKDNQRNISCIPKGEYEVKKRTSKRFKEHFHITGVDNRSYILIHSGNYHHQIRGCVLVGDDLRDINGDNRMDVVNSKSTLNKLLDLMPDQFKLEIV